MMETRNVIIKEAKILIEEGILSCWLVLDLGNKIQQAFGGYTLYAPKSNKHHKIQSVAGHFIFRIMEIAGVQRWEDLKGKPVRANCNHSKVQAIGHIVNNDWFDPKLDFSTLEKGE